MKTMTTLLVFLLSLALSGCAKTVWRGGPLSPETDRATRVQQFQRDSYECQRDSRVSGGHNVPAQRSNDPFGTASTNMLDATDGLADRIQSKRMFVACMESKGYTQHDVR
jgi:hypothetical protein